MHVGIVKFVIPVPTPDAMLKTPYFSSIFQATSFWVLVTWLLVIAKCECTLLGMQTIWLIGSLMFFL
jgi:palmitoyltransferase